jgi:hypothetical protein
VKTAKLVAYGAVVRVPQSNPACDMHGLLRGVVLAKSKHAARQIFKRDGCLDAAFLGPTESAVESSAVRAGLDTKKTFNRWQYLPDLPTYCPLPLAYLRVEHYHRNRKPR